MGSDRRRPRVRRGGGTSLPPGLDAEAWRGLERRAYRLYARWELDRAEAIARRLVRLCDERSYPHYLLGELAWRRRDYARAAEHLDDAIERGRADPMTLCRAGEAHLRGGGERRRAAELLGRCLEVAGDRHSELVRRASYYLQRIERG